jgi:hypothetical protein
MSTTRHRDLQGLTALVTGATAGLGRAIAVQLAREGAEAVVHGRDAARGAQTIEAIRAEGGRARFVAADLSNPADIKRLTQETGDVDIRRAIATALETRYSAPEFESTVRFGDSSDWLFEYSVRSLGGPRSHSGAPRERRSGPLTFTTAPRACGTAPSGITPRTTQVRSRSMIRDHEATWKTEDGGQS